MKIYFTLKKDFLFFFNNSSSKPYNTLFIFKPKGNQADILHFSVPREVTIKILSKKSFELLGRNPNNLAVFQFFFSKSVDQFIENSVVNMNMEGVGYKIDHFKGQIYSFHAGFSHKSGVRFPKEVGVSVLTSQSFLISSNNAQKLGENASDIKNMRPWCTRKKKGFSLSRISKAHSSVVRAFD